MMNQKFACYSADHHKCSLLSYNWKTIAQLNGIISTSDPLKHQHLWRGYTSCSEIEMWHGSIKVFWVCVPFSQQHTLRREQQREMLFEVWRTSHLLRIMLKHDHIKERIRRGGALHLTKSFTHLQTPIHLSTTVTHSHTPAVIYI